MLNLFFLIPLIFVPCFFLYLVLQNRQDLLDFAVAGPLTGMVCSIILLSYGVVLTASADAATYQSFPGLPLLLLRQSSLGGGIIDIFLGNGVLNVPMSAEGTQALATTLIPLHPFAVAGYFSLIVNALSMIPAGSESDLFVEFMIKIAFSWSNPSFCMITLFLVSFRNGWWPGVYGNIWPIW